MVCPCVYVHYCCSHELPQIQELQTTQIYYITFLEVRGPKVTSLGQNQGVTRSVFLLEALCPCLFQFLEAVSPLRPRSFIKSPFFLCVHCHITFSLWHWSSYFLLNHLYDYTGTTQAIQNNLPVSASAKSPFAMEGNIFTSSKH